MESYSSLRAVYAEALNYPFRIISASSITGADTYEVLPQEDYYPYTYDELCDVAKQEQNDNARPAIRDAVPDLSGYDTIFH